MHIERLLGFRTVRVALARALLIAPMLAGASDATEQCEVLLSMGVESGGAFDNAQPEVSEAVPVSFNHALTIDSTTMFGSGASGPGSVAVIGSSTYVVTDPGNDTSADGTATVISTIDDVTFDGVGILNGVYVKVDLTGTIGVSGDTHTAATSVDFNFKLNGQLQSAYRTDQLPAVVVAPAVAVAPAVPAARVVTAGRKSLR